MKHKSLALLLIVGICGCSDPENQSSGSNGDSTDGSQGATSAQVGSTNQTQGDGKQWNGKDLLAKATSKGSESGSGIKMLKALLDEEMMPDRIMNGKLVSKTPDGKIIYGGKARPTVELLQNEGTVDLTFKVELSFDKEAYYKQIVPRLTRLLGQLASRTVDENFVRPMRIAEYEIPLTGKPCLVGRDDPLMHSYWDKIAFGDKDFHFRDLKKTDPWLTKSKKEFLVACEAGSNPDRTRCRYAVYALDKKTYLKTFLHAKSRLFPTPKIKIQDKNEETLWQESWPGIAVSLRDLANGRSIRDDFRIPSPEYDGEYEDDDPHLEDPEGLVRVRFASETGPICVTIAPEFHVGRMNLAMESFVTSKKINMSQENLGKLQQIIIEL
jgi:hypothetical protein